MKYLGNFKWTTYPTIAKAFENTDANETIYVAYDLKETDAKKAYIRLAVHKIKQLVSEISNNNHSMYEILPPDVPVKPYFDLEIEHVDEQGNHTREYTSEQMQDNLNTFLQWIIRVIRQELNVELMIDNFAILDSCRTDKLSYHIIIPTKLYFENVAVHKEFIAYLYERISTQDVEIGDQLSYQHKGVKTKYIFDRVPYSKNQCFRLPYQSK